MRKALLAIPMTFMIGCNTLSPIEQMLENDRLDYAEIAREIDKEVNHEFQIQKNPVCLTPETVLDLTGQHNYSILVARHAYLSAERKYSRQTYEQFDPTLYTDFNTSSNRPGLQDVLMNARNGARMKFSEGSEIELFLENVFNNHPIGGEEEYHDHLGGVRLKVPLHFLSFEDERLEAEHYTKKIKMEKARTRYLEQSRGNLLDSLLKYADASKYASRLELQNQYIARLKKVRAMIVDLEEAKQVELDISTAEAHLGRLQGKFENKVSNLKNQVGIPLEQKIEINGAQTFQYTTKTGLFEHVLQKDHALVLLIEQLKLAYLEKKEGEANNGILPWLYGEYNNNFRGEGEFILGFNIEIKFGPDKEDEAKEQIKSLQYLIKKRKNDLELQTSTILRDLERESDRLAEFQKTCRESEIVLEEAESRLKKGQINYTDMKRLLDGWYQNKNELINTNNSGTEAQYKLQALIGGLDE